ncbi:MAG: antibiotic biosynthesis monooxygenase [Actinobacteria bacterium]|uniref:Unannotated protein n=1 Tax=freshwater metagenome TaxID=449393 RepID=A0A6J6NIL8_9ZZZZ|nr:antibiotic biosynthesis monooxygenase [Actinomycetota bacterium]
MVIVSGHLVVDPAAREDYLDGCRDVVRAARESPGCLDFALSADLLDPARINILELWESQAAVDSFRGDGVGEEQGAAIRSASVHEHDVATTRRLA